MIDLGLGWLWAIGAGVIALAATWLGGRKAAKTDAKMKEAERYQATRKAMGDVEIHDDPAALRDWLRERGQSKRDL